ncbi:hypothetical protein ACIBEH_33225 [Nocardia salmonicida]
MNRVQSTNGLTCTDLAITDAVSTLEGLGDIATTVGNMELKPTIH